MEIPEFFFGKIESILQILKLKCFNCCKQLLNFYTNKLFGFSFENIQIQDSTKENRLTYRKKGFQLFIGFILF